MRSDRIRIVGAYALWAAVCAGLAGAAVALLHTALFSYVPTRSAFVETLLGDLAVALALAVGQGALALAVGGLAARWSRTLRYTVLLGLLIGLFDLAMYLVQMLVPATELGWGPDLAILAAATVAITLLGTTRDAAAP